MEEEAVFLQGLFFPPSLFFLHSFVSYFMLPSLRPSNSSLPACFLPLFLHLWSIKLRQLSAWESKWSLLIPRLPSSTLDGFVILILLLSAWRHPHHGHHRSPCSGAAEIWAEVEHRMIGRRKLNYRVDWLRRIWVKLGYIIILRLGQVMPC